MPGLVGSLRAVVVSSLAVACVSLMSGSALAGENASIVAVFTPADEPGEWACLSAVNPPRSEPTTEPCNKSAPGVVGAASSLQQWRVLGPPSGHIVSEATGRCLTLPECTNCFVKEDTCGALSTQDWTVVPKNDTVAEAPAVTLVATTATGTRQCLTRHEGNGQAAQVWNCDGVSRQRWQLGSPPSAHQCRDDRDCNLNGLCDASTGVCACDAGWTGARCSLLDLVPATDKKATHALRLEGTSTWGGSVAYSRTDGRYHMLAAIMEGGCGLDSYEHNSAVVHAVSDTPEGPYTIAPSKHTLGAAANYSSSLVVPPFAHNPTVVQAPNGSWVLYHIGCGMRQKKPYTGCRNGTTPLKPPPQDFASMPGPVLPSTNNYTCSGGYGDPPNVFVTDDLARGPWRMHGLAVRTSSWMTHMDNPAPVIHPNGSVLLLARKWAKTSSTIGVVHAPRWDADGTEGPQDVYSLPEKKLDFAHSVEDPFTWVDSRGNYHAIFHSGCPAQPTGGWLPLAWAAPARILGCSPGVLLCCRATTSLGRISFSPLRVHADWVFHEPPVGRHAFSSDGLHWDLSEEITYNTTVMYVDGTNTTYHRRERPHLLLDDQRRPTHLFNGVTDDADQPGYSGFHADHSFTIVQAIRAKRAMTKELPSNNI